MSDWTTDPKIREVDLSLAVETRYLSHDGKLSFPFTARDAEGRLYLLCFVDRDDEDYDELYVALPLSQERYRELEAGRLMLKDAFLEPEEGELVMMSFGPGERERYVFLPADYVFFQYLPGRVPLPRRLVPALDPADKRSSQEGAS